MRIGIVTGEYPPMQGGVGAYTHILAQELTRQSEQVFVFSSQTTGNSDGQIELTNSITSWSPRSLMAIRHWASSKHIDLLNLQFQTAAFAMSPWIHFLPDVIRTIPVVTTFHDLRYPYLFPKAGFFRTWIVRHLAGSSNGVIVTNGEDADQLNNLPNLSLIPIGSNILKPLNVDFDPLYWREKAGAQTGEFLIAYFGLINHTKGLEVLLDSLADLRGQNIPARLILIGGGTGSSDPTNAAFNQVFRAKIEQLGLAPYIGETGYLEDDEQIGAYLSASDVVALPFNDGASYRRGSLMAAIRYGCAIVTTQPQNDNSAFQHGKNMWFVPAGDSTKLSNALRQIYESTSLREQMRQGAAELAHVFEWPQIAKRTIAFFERVLA